MSRARLEVQEGDIVESKDKRLTDRLWDVIKVDSLIAKIENQTTGRITNYGLAVMNDFFTIYKIKEK